MDFDIINDDVWVFLSHSHKDYDKVIQVRNLLEKRNIRPIMFFLKCLEDDTEVDALIKREIDSRHRFILCDSKNAKESNWVQEEVKYIKEEKNRSYETIDLDNMSIEEIDNKLQEFEKRLSICYIYTSDRTMDYNILVGEAINYGFRIKSLCVDEIKYSDIVDVIKDFLNVCYVCLIINDSIVQNIAVPISELGKESKRLIFMKRNERNMFTRIVNSLNFEQAMDLSQYAWGQAKVDLLEQAIYNGGTPSMQFILANIYEKGLYGIKKDLYEALSIYEDMLHSDGIATNNHIDRVHKLIEESEHS